MRRIVSLFITFILCTWALQAQRIVFTPQWTPQSQFAGYYVAQEMGFYQEAGVEVDFQHLSASYSAVNRLYILCVGTIVALGIWFPARQAMKIEPAEALHDE